MWNLTQVPSLGAPRGPAYQPYSSSETMTYTLTTTTQSLFLTLEQPLTGLPTAHFPFASNVPAVTVGKPSSSGEGTSTLCYTTLTCG